MGEVRVGISGWRYAGWRGRFYPPGLPQRLELAHAASLLDTVEINGSFSSLQRPTSYLRWAAEVPEDFVLAVKGGPLRHALEPRHASFADPAAAGLLRRHGMAMVVADTAGRHPRFDAVTTDLVYVRLHGETELYASGYDDASLDRWAAAVRGWARDADVLVYLDNDAKGHAPFDAQRLAARLR